MNAKKLFIFASGAAVGFTAAFFLQKKKYEDILERESEGFRQALARYKKTTKKAEATTDKKEKAPEETKKNLDKAEKIIEKQKYAPEKAKEKKPKVVSESAVAPKVVSLNEYTKSKYDKVNVTCYADGTYAEDGFQIDDPNDAFGDIDLDKLSQENEIYILNPIYETAYDILYDHRTYDEAEEDGDFDRR